MMNDTQTSSNAIEEQEQKLSKSEKGSESVLVATRFALSDPERKTFFSADTSRPYEIISIPPPVAGRLNNYKRVFSLAMRVWKAIRKTKPALVFFEDQRTGVPCCLFLRMLGVKTPVMIWNFNMCKPYRNAKWLITKMAVQSAVALVVYSQHEQKVYADSFGVPPSKFRFKLYSGPCLDDARYVSLLKNTRKEDYVVSPGSWGRDYELLAKVASRIPSTRFIVLALPDSVAGVKFPDNVEIINGIEELEYCRYIAQARACYVPVANQITANGHIAIVQAMSLRTPLITNPTPGTMDYISERTAIFCSDNDADAVAGQIAQVCEHPENSKAMVDAAYEFACANFGVDRDIAMIDEVLSITNKPVDN